MDAHKEDYLPKLWNAHLTYDFNKKRCGKLPISSQNYKKCNWDWGDSLVFENTIRW